MSGVNSVVSLCCRPISVYFRCELAVRITKLAVPVHPPTVAIFIDYPCWVGTKPW